MIREKFLGIGLFVTLLCCFTPVLVVLIGVFGLSWFTGYLDYGLTPLLGFFLTALILVLYSKYERKSIVYVGSLFVMGFVILYLVWGVLLGILVLLGALLAIMIYRTQFKKACKECVVK